MPRLAGVNLLGLLLAGIAIFMVGGIWFGALFSEMWQTANGYTEAELIANDVPAITWGGGLLIPLILSFGIGWLIKETGTKGLVPCMVFGAKLAILFAAPILAYSFVYNVTHSTTDLLLDVGHSFVGFILGAAVLSFFD